MLKLPDHEVMKDVIHDFDYVRVLGPGQKCLTNSEDVDTRLDWWIGGPLDDERKKENAINGL